MLDYRQYGSGAGRITDALFLLEPVDDTFRYAYIDSAYTRLTGLRSEGVVGQRLETFLTAAQVAFLTEKCEQAVVARGSVSYEEHVATLDHDVTVVCRLIPQYDN